MRNLPQQVDNNIIKFRVQKNWSEDFGIMLNGIIYSVGIHEPINLNDPMGRLEVQNFFNFIKSEFPGFSNNDIKDAFIKLVACKLEFWYNNKPQNSYDHFGTFSMAYLGKVLNAYSKYKSDQEKKQKILKAEDLLKEHSKPKEINFDEVREHSRVVYKKWNANEDLSDANWTNIYFLFKKDGKIKFEKEELDEFQENVMEQVLIEKRLRVDEGKNYFDLDLILENKMFFYCECRKRAVINYFKGL